MRKKMLSWILTVAMVLSLFTALPITANAQTGACEIIDVDGITFVKDCVTLDEALTDVEDGQTIKLFENITHNSDIMAYAAYSNPALNRSFNIDLNGCTLTVNASDWACFYAGSSCDISVIDSAGGGTLYANSTSAALRADDPGSTITIDASLIINTTGENSVGIYTSYGGAVTVSNATIIAADNGVEAYGFSGATLSSINVTGSITSSGLSSYGAYVNGGGIVSVTGDISTPNLGYGVYAETGNATVTGDVTAGSFAAYAIGSGSNVTITGDATATGVDSEGAEANNGGTITVNGNASGGRYGAFALYGGTISVTGNTTAAGGLSPEYSAAAIAEGSGSSMAVGGNATVTGSNGYGVQANNGGSVTVGGNVSATGTGCYGAYSGGLVTRSYITIEGSIEATSYVIIDGDPKSMDQTTEPTTKSGYCTYSWAENSSVVWVRNPLPAFDAFCWVVTNQGSAIPTGPAKLGIPDGPLTSIRSVPEGFWMTGADFVDDQLYGVDYNSSNNSGLYTIDVQTGEYELVGQTGVNLTGFAYDIKNRVAYAVGYLNASSLYTVNLNTGDLTSMGEIGDSYIIIDIAVDNDGNLYGLDINNDVLLSINPRTAAVTQIGSLGLNINYAQDLAYDRDNGILYGTLYANSSTAGLYSINTSTGAATPEYAFSAEVDGFAIPYTVSDDNCIVPGCTTSIPGGGFTEFTMIEGEKYYHISNAAQLAHINEHLDLNYIQTEDIDLSQYNGGLWNPIGGFGDPDNNSNPESFTGKYLGNGHRITNLAINFNDAQQNAANAGLFAKIEGADASISGLTVTVTGVNVTAYNYSYCGAIAAELYGGSISDCHVAYLGDVDTSDTPIGYHGGIAGTAYPIWNSQTQQYNNAVIDGCSVTFESGSLIADGGSKFAGGIVGRSDIKITNCDVVIAENEMIRSTYVGGISGMMYSKIMGTALENCTVTGDGFLALSPQQYYSYFIGGLVGRFVEGGIRNCTNGVFIDASGATMLNDGEQVYAGGLIGYLGTRSDLFGCSNTGEVSAVVANNIVNSYGNPGTAEGDEYVYAGGIAGYIYGYSNRVTIENCENNADISSTNQILGMRAYAGGLAGHVDSADGNYAGVRILNCANLGADKMVYAQAGTTMTGGLLGSTTFHDFANPNISLSNSYNRASVTGESNSAPAKNGMCVGITAGGIVGAAGEITVANTYSTAATSAISTHGADAYEGGIFGVLYMTTATQNYYEKNIAVVKAVGGKVEGMEVIASDDLAGAYEGATATQLKTKDYYGDDWVWYVNGGMAPDYYSSMDPWRFTAANSYPVLKGLLYSPTPPSGGGSYTPSKYQIAATSNTGGAITPAGNSIVTEFGSITFTIKPDKNYIIKDVLVDGVSVGAVATYNFSSVRANHMIEAKFEHDCPSKPFTDVDITQWYHEGIDYVLLAGLFKGTSSMTFEPNSAMTRAMLVTVLHRLEGNPAATSGNPFADVASGNWYSGAVVWANAKGIVKGYDSDTFGTNDFITREQLATILYRYAQYKGYDVSVGEDTNILSYVDALNISEYAIPAIQWACGAGVMQGDGAKLDPQGSATRAQVAAMLMRFIENVAK